MSEQDIQRLHRIGQADLDEMMTATSQRRARAYQREHRVLNRRVYKNSLYAQVRGSEPQPYEVEISVQDGEVYGYCSCPYDWGGWCKHIGAVIMEWIDHPEQFQVLDAPPPGIFDQGSEDRGDQGEDWDQDEEWEEEPDEASQFSPKDSLSVLLPGREKTLELLAQEVSSMLQNNTVEELREIAHYHQIPLTSSRKDEIIAAVSKRLADPAHVQVQVAQLDDTKLRLLTFIHLSTPPGYGSALNGLRPFGIQGLGNQAIQKHVEQLLKQGLLISFKQKGILYLVLPQIVRLYLPPLPNAVTAYPPSELSSASLKYQEFPSLISNLYRVWTLISENRPRRTPSWPLSKAETQWENLIGWRHDPDEIAQIDKGGRYYLNIPSSLSVPPTPPFLEETARQRLCTQLEVESEQIEFYCALLHQLGAIGGEPGQATQAHLNPIQSLLSRPVNEQLQLVFNTWHVLQDWSEMDMVLRNTPEISVRRNPSYAAFKLKDLYEEWRQGRIAVLRFLSLLTEGEWVSFDAFLRIVHEIFPNIFHAFSHANVWWIESARKKRQFGAGYEDWLLSYGRPVIATLTGPLNWLGAVEIAYHQNQPVAIRLTAVGSFILGRRKAISPSAGPAYKPDQIVNFRDDLTVEVLSGLAHPNLYVLLGRIGRLENATAQSLRYRLDAQGVKRALEQGETAAGLIAQLTELAQKPLPQTWQQRLHEWEVNYGRLHLYQNIALIELADDLALQELLVATSLRNRLLYRFSNRLVAIQPEAIDQLVQEMEKRGYTPRVTD